MLFQNAIYGTCSGNRVFRGEESNLAPKLSGYWVSNATAEYNGAKYFTLSGKADNIFDASHHRFGVYGVANEVLGPPFNDGRFVSPGVRTGGGRLRLKLQREVVTKKSGNKKPA